MEQGIDPVSWGVISTADIGLRKVIPAMMQSDLCRVDAIASRSLDSAAEAAQRLGIPKSYGSYQELLEDPELEAVYIPLPNHMHLEWAMAAAAAGKHVLCEKPMAMTSAEAAEMVDASDRAGVLLMEGFMYRLHPMWVTVSDLIEAGAVGEVTSVQTIFSYFNDDPTNIRNIPQVGGGALYDIGCYAVNVARFVFGSEPTDVKALIRRDPRLGTDVVTSALLQFEQGHSDFVCSTQAEPDQRVVILGSEGRIVVDIPFNIPPDRPTQIALIAGGDPPVAPGIETHEIPTADPYSVQGDAFSRAIRSGSAAPIDPRDAIANLEVIEKIFADART